MRKVPIVALVVLLLLPVFSWNVTAELSSPEPEVPLEYAHVSAITASLSISGGNASCWGIGASKRTWTKTKVTTKLQRRPSSSSAWTTLKTWSAEGAGTDDVTAGGYYPVSAGYTYRTYVICQIKDADGNVLETAYVSNTKTY